MNDTAVILLAAGESSRMGSPKQILDFHGQPLLRHTAGLALAAGLGPVFVVLGANLGRVRPVLDGLPVQIVENNDWRLGMGSSIAAGLRAADAAPVSGAILALADQPLVTPGFLQTLAAAGAPIAASRYAGTAGVPVYFRRDAFPLLFALAPDQGCKGVILSHPDTVLLDCPEAEQDIDTPAQYLACSLEAGR